MISFAPGPVPTPNFIQEILSKDLPHHRTAYFQQKFSTLQPRLQNFFGTKQTVLSLSCSGAGVMEAATQTLNIGDSVLIIVNGVYGELWKSIVEKLPVHVDTICTEQGQSLRTDDLHQKLQEKSYAAVFMQSCETSTGILNPLFEITQVISKFPKTLLIVDACSALGAIEIQMDQWGIDILLTSSQKVLMSPSGAGFISLSEKAWNRIGYGSGTYFNLMAEREHVLKHGLPRFTPSVAAILSVCEVLEKFVSNSELQLSYQNRMKSLARFNMAAGVLCGFEIFPDNTSPTITVFKLPATLNGSAVRDHLMQKNIFVLGGFGPLSNSLLRVGQMGAIYNSNVQRLWLGIFESLEQQGIPMADHLPTLLQHQRQLLGPDLWQS